MKKAIIIGAGPAGLTAAYELLKRTDITPIVLEKSEYIGGISRTIQYKGNRMDMGPHRFFSKSDRVMNWWLNIIPLEKDNKTPVKITYQNKSREISSDPQINGSQHTNNAGNRMLIIQRLTRIYFLRKFFSYPIQLSIDTLKALGLSRTLKILLSFTWAKLFPRPAKSLEDFIINQFGKELYLLFFKDYTEKVWGVPCQDISAEWGAQRIKGVSLGRAISQAVKNSGKAKTTPSDISQKKLETSLIEQFLYPKFGPGSLWEEVARQIEAMGGKIFLHQDVEDIYTTDNKVCSIHSLNSITGEVVLFEGDYFFSSMPVQELIAGMGENVPVQVKEVAAGLQYRDFINVGILLKQLTTPSKTANGYDRLDLRDNWIYIQEKDVKVGRLMIYNNWGGGMINDPNTIWLGMEYFCNKTDNFWALDDAAIQAIAIQELEKMGLARVEDVLDSTVRRMEKTYPAYFGTYSRFEEIREWVDQHENLFLIGRNGMHKYNNADHSMLTAMVAVDNIANGIITKENVWAINTEQEYHEEKPSPSTPPTSVGNKTPSLIDYIWNNKWHRAYCIFSLLIFLIQFLLFKVKYPFANYMPDSYSYLEAAYTNADVNMWPVAYSKFLRLISAFTHSDKLVVASQYFFIQISSLTLLFTLLHFANPGKIVRNVLFVFFLFNPIPLFVSNYISSDALFIGTSLLWISSLLWILYRPNIKLILIQAILLLGCFTLRYNAIYYPVITALAFFISRQDWKLKVAGIALSLILISCSIWYTSNKMQQITGTRQFSAFGGWQLANNALYMYEHIPSAKRTIVPSRFTRLELAVDRHMDTLNKVKLSHQDSINNYWYLWSGKGPLVQYMVKEWARDSTTSYFNRWASVGPLYMDYAFYLIRKYPWTYIQTFLVSNAIKFAVPPTEFLGTYNMGGDSVRPLAKDWFNYKSQLVKASRDKDNSFLFTGWYAVFSALVNLLLLINVVGLVALGNIRQLNTLAKLLALLIPLWLLNMGFSILASPIVLRYQVFSILLTFCLAMLTGEVIYAPTQNLKKKDI